MTQHIKGNKGNNKKDHVLIRQYDEDSEVITTEPMSFNRAIEGMMFFDSKGYKVLRIEKVAK